MQKCSEQTQRRAEEFEKTKQEKLKAKAAISAIKEQTEKDVHRLDEIQSAYLDELEKEQTKQMKSLELQQQKLMALSDEGNLDEAFAELEKMFSSDNTIKPEDIAQKVQDRFLKSANPE